MVDDGRLTDRRWRFASAEFDEGSWTLTVAGERVTLENKPLRLLRELLDHPGQVVSKDALLDAVWPGVIVVEGSLTTAMNKLRRALGDNEGRIIETVPGIGYRLAVAVDAADDAHSPTTPSQSAATQPLPTRLALVLASVAMLAMTGVAFASRWAAPEPVVQPITRLDVLAAMRTLDLPALRSLIARGWDPRQPFGKERNPSIATLLEVCEWNRSHDKQQLMLGVRLLLDAGANPTDRNVWGDTAYSIAAAPRYCGPDHPATLMLKGVCTGSSPTMDPRCLADYAHSEWPQVTPPLASSKPSG